MSSGTAATPGRALDGIAYGLIGLILVLYSPWSSAETGGVARQWDVLPVAWLVFSAFQLSRPFRDTPALSGLCLRLRASALIVLGFSPFVGWWIRCSEPPYLVLGSVVGVLAGVWFLIELSSLLLAIATLSGGGRRETDARIARMLVLYLILIPILSLHISFLAALVIVPGTVLSDLERFWLMIPPLFRYLTVIPLLNLARVCWQSSGRSWSCETVPAGSATEGARETADNNAQATDHST